MKEIWKPIKGYEGLYEISNFGNMRKPNGKIIKGTINKGYNRVCLTKDHKEKNHFVHRLVLESFGYEIGNLTVDHKDSNKQNNRIDNLEIVTTYENTRRAYINGLRKGKNIIPVLQYDLEGNFLKEYSSINEASRETNLDVRHISRNIKGIGKQIGGFKFVKKELVSTRGLIAS